MSSSTVSRYRESTTITTSPQTYDRGDTSFAEEDALDAIAKEVKLSIRHSKIEVRFLSRRSFVFTINANKIVSPVNFVTKN